MILLLRCGLGLLFVFSGFQKLVEPYQNFLYVIESYEIFPYEAARLAARAVPWFELLSGSFLILGIHIKTALIALWIFDSALILTVLQALGRGLEIRECGCFGSILPLTLGQVVVLDIVLWLLFFIVWRSSLKAYALSLDQFLRGR